MRSTLIIFGLLFLTRTAGASEDSPVVADEVILVFNRQDDRLEVEELMRLGRGPSAGEQRGTLSIPLAKGAKNPALAGEEQKGIRLKGRSLVIRGPLPEEGAQISLRYHLPIVDGRASFEQDLGVRVGSVQAISTWTIRGAGLEGEGFSQARLAEIHGGLVALVASNANPKNGRIVIELSSLSKGPESTLRQVTFFLSAILLSLGLIFRVRSEMKGKREPAKDETAKTG